MNDSAICNMHLNGCLDKIERKVTETKELNAITSDLQLLEREFPAISISSRLPGLIVIHDFINKEEEMDIISRLDADTSTPWALSTWNGHCDSKHYGYKTQFGRGLSKEVRAVRKNDVSKGEHDIPEFLAPCVAKLSRLKLFLVHKLSQKSTEGSQFATLSRILRNFEPNECNANSYIKSRKDFMGPHFDDRELSGPLLMNLSMCGDAKMCYTKSDETEIIDLPRCTLQIVMFDARYRWMHSIRSGDINSERRISITWRQIGAGNRALFV